MTVPTSEPNLRAAFTNQAPAMATVEDYASASGLEVADVVREITALAQRRLVRIEPYGHRLFVHTAPSGRPAPNGLAAPVANRWELLRRNRSEAEAFDWWELDERLRSVGWTTTCDEAAIRAHLERVAVDLAVGLRLKASPHTPVPVLAYPDLGELRRADGTLDRLAAAGAKVVAVVCSQDSFDAVVAAVRVWAGEHGWEPPLQVLLLAEPDLSPVVLRPSDNSITPVTYAK